MDIQSFQTMLDEIDGLITKYAAAPKDTERRLFIGPQSGEVDDFIKHGAFPASDIRSAPAKELLAIAMKLKDEGGNERLAFVLESYRQKYGTKRASTLNTPWHYLAEQPG